MQLIIPTRGTPTLEVVGSSPAGRTMKNSCFLRKMAIFSYFLRVFVLLIKKAYHTLYHTFRDNKEVKRFATLFFASKSR